MEIQITRELDGKTLIITLTDTEVEKAYRLRERHYNTLDMYHKLNNMIGGNDWYEGIDCSDDCEFDIGDVTLTGKKLKEIATPEFMDDLVDMFRNALEQNDGYWESFWCTAECVIEAAIEDKVKEEN